MIGSTFVSCSWCHTVNPVAVRSCPECHHRADRPRMLCDCSRCATGPRGFDPTDLADAAARGAMRHVVGGRYYFRIPGDLPPGHPISRVAFVALEIRGDRVVVLAGEETIAFTTLEDLERWARGESSAGASS
jgi:hypothetical protein